MFYIKQIKNNHVILYLYVDDIMIIGSNIQVININKSFLLENSDEMDLSLSYGILRIKLFTNSNSFVLT
jgi:hypothetical protein